MLKQILGEFQKVNNRLDGLENAQQELKKDFQNGQQELKNEFQNSQLELKQELKNDFQNAQQELKKDFQKGQQELKNDFQKSQLELKQELKKDVLSIKDNLISGLGPYFENIEKHIDAKTDEIKIALENQQIVIDTLSIRSIKQESEIKDLKRMLTNQK